MHTWKRNLMICWLGCFSTACGMSLVIPFLSFYIEELGVQGTENIARWSGLAFGVTFLMGAIVSPIWGRLGDKYGRKVMLIRASLGMAAIMAVMGLVTNVYQLVILRFLMGAVSGFISTSMTFIATETPKNHSSWAISILSTGGTSGSLLGPVLGGYLAHLIGFRHVFFVTGLFLFASFLIVYFFLQESPINKKEAKTQEVFHWSRIPYKSFLISLFITTFVLQFANMSIEPIVTLYVQHLVGADAQYVTIISGAVMSAAGIAVVLTAPRLGKLSDSIGPQKVLMAALFVASFTFIPQGFVKSAWQLFLLRFILGISQAGLLPSIQSLLKKYSPESSTGRIFGYNQSFQFLGNVGGAVIGGQIAGLGGFSFVFLSTALLLFINGLWVVYNNYSLSHQKHEYSHPHVS